MNYRTVKILAEETLTGAGTKTIDVNLKDIISRIILKWEITMAGYGMNSYPHADITKIELVDGSDVLFSLNGGQCQALCIYDRKIPSLNGGWYVNANNVTSIYGIDFGRSLFDKVLALDPTKFRNLQLKVSYDSDVMDTGATEGRLEVLAEVFDEKVISPVGFLSAKELHSRTPPASGYWYVDLPTDYPIKKMLVQGFYKANEPYTVVTEARLDEDNEKRVPFDWDLEDYERVMQGEQIPILERIYGYADTASTYAYYTTPSNYSAILLGNCLDADAYGGPTTILQGGYCTIHLSVNTHLLGAVSGYLPNHCFEFPFGDQKDLDDWYDVTRLGSLRLRLKAGASGANGTVAAVLQQLRRY